MENECPFLNGLSHLYDDIYSVNRLNNYNQLQLPEYIFSLYSNWDIDPDIFGDPLSRSRAACLFILTQAYLFSQLRAVLELARFFFLPFKIFADKNRHRCILAGNPRSKSHSLTKNNNCLFSLGKESENGGIIVKLVFFSVKYGF